MNDKFDITKSPLWNGVADETGRGLDIRFADCSVYTEADIAFTPKGDPVLPAQQRALCEN
ncbi:MAG: hypothetical protein HYU97_06735, partial [Deltaproteobacteria bacterium]|nr:hypothetical protein [Deltaproteobacteria bacterium]